jgi:transcriptional regulator of acetoin/glycerol metabolism
MILHDVGAMGPADQIRLLEWSQQAAGHTQIVSTASTSLLPLVDAGMFNDMLYYRLNTVFVDATVPSGND